MCASSYSCEVKQSTLYAQFKVMLSCIISSDGKISKPCEHYELADIPGAACVVYNNKREWEHACVCLPICLCLYHNSETKEPRQPLQELIHQR